MKAPPKYSILCYWSDDNFSRRVYWRDLQRYMILEPTGPTAKSYWAYKMGGWGIKTKKVRIQLEVLGSGRLVTEEEYNRLFAQAQKEEEQKKMWKVLSS